MSVSSNASEYSTPLRLLFVCQMQYIQSRHEVGSSLARPMLDVQLGKIVSVSVSMSVSTPHLTNDR